MCPYDVLMEKCNKDLLYYSSPQKYVLKAERFMRD